MDSHFLLFDDLDPELWTAPLSPQVVPNAWQPLPDSLFPSGNIANSPANQSPTPKLPTTLSSPLEQLEDSPQPSGENLDLSEPTGSGHLQGKCLLLTWSQVPPSFNHELIKTHLETIGTLKSLAVGLENHADGGRHFHACVIYLKKISRRPKAFSILGRTADVRVANSKRGPLATCILNYWKYAQKEDPSPLIVGDPPAAPKIPKTEIYRKATLLVETQNVQAALDYLCIEAPVDYIQKLDTLTRNLTSHRDKRMRLAPQGRTLNDFRAHPDIPDDWRVLFMWGKSGVGKTQYAKALLPGATIVSHGDQLKDCDFTKGIIFDDFAVGHWPPTSAIHLVDWDEPRGIHCRYAHVTVPPHTRKIFTFNKCLDEWAPVGISEEQFQAIRRRVIEIEIKSSLF